MTPAYLHHRPPGSATLRPGVSHSSLVTRHLSLVTGWWGVVAPEPAQRVGHDGATVLAAVEALAELEAVVVALELQGRRHLLVGQRPVAELVVQVLPAALQEHADGLLRLRADQGRVDVAAADVRETADVRQHLAELVRHLPRGRERADAARTDAADGPALGVGAELHVRDLLGLGEEFVAEE